MGIKRAAFLVGTVLTVAMIVGLVGCVEDDKGVTPPPPPATTTYYTLTTAADPTVGGKVTRSSTEARYISGTTVTLTAEANPDYTFVEWAGASTSKSASITITMSRDLSFTAKFQLKETGGGDDTTGTEDPPYNNNIESVKIGDLTWTKNLNIETSEGSWCYNNDPANCATYGRLYTWEAAKSACASMGGGWRLPTQEDWNKLIFYAGGTYVAGKKLKSKSGWNDYNGASGNGTDDYGFSALPGGGASGNPFIDVGRHGYWWSATEYVPNSVLYYRYKFSFDFDGVDDYSSNMSSAWSVRCVKN